MNTRTLRTYAHNLKDYARWAETCVVGTMDWILSIEIPSMSNETFRNVTYFTGILGAAVAAVFGLASVAPYHDLPPQPVETIRYIIKYVPIPQGILYTGDQWPAEWSWPVPETDRPQATLIAPRPVAPVRVENAPLDDAEVPAREPVKEAAKAEPVNKFCDYRWYRRRHRHEC